MLRRLICLAAALFALFSLASCYASFYNQGF